MEYSTWAFILLALAVCLLIAEVFIPTGGAIGVASTVSIVAAIICAWMAWWESNPRAFWLYLGGMAIVLPVTIVVAFQFWPNTPIGKRAILHAPAPEEIASFVAQEEKHKSLVGKVGETVTMLNPAGMASIDGERVHCQSEGMILDAGTRVVVIAARLNGVVVRKVASTTPLTNSRGRGGSPADSLEPLDFDLT
jgi:membrane-bound ClpP family serine protease